MLQLQHIACIAIQATVRGFLGRQRARAKAEAAHRRWLAEQAELQRIAYERDSAAATKIQTQMRGFKARRRAELLRSHREAARRAAAASRDTPRAEAPEAEAALSMLHRA